MKKTAISVLSVLFIVALLATACREGGAEQSTTTVPAQDSILPVQAIAAPVDSLAIELDEAANEIEQDGKDLQSALDSL